MPQLNIQQIYEYGKKNGWSRAKLEKELQEAEEHGVIAPRKDGFIEESFEGLQHGVLTGVKGFGSTLEEAGLGDGLHNYMTDVMDRNQHLLPDPTYKATSFDPAHLGRTVGTGVGQSGTALTAGVVTTALTGGNPVAGGAVTTGLIFSQTYGDEVKDFRKVMPGQDERTVQGLAFFSALGQGLIESVAGPEAIASGLAKKIIKGALKETVKQQGKARVLQVLTTMGKSALKGGAGEGAEEVFQGLVSNIAKIAGGADIPVMTLNDAIEQFAGGALPGAFMSGGAGIVEASQHIEAEPKEMTDLLGEAGTTENTEDTEKVEVEQADGSGTAEELRRDEKKKYDDSQVKSFKKHWNKTEELPSEELTENIQNLTKDSSLDEKAVLVLKPKSRLTKALAEVSKELTGQEPVYFLPKTPEAGLANGFIGKNNQLFINVETMANNPGVTTGHEFGHFLNRTDNATYKDFQKILAENLKDNHSEYLESILKTYDDKGIDLTQAQGMDELTNDVIGDFFVDDKFWKEVFSSKQDPGKLKKIADAIIRFVDTIAGKLKGVNGVNRYLSDLEKVRSEAAKIISEKLGVENTDIHGQTPSDAKAMDGKQTDTDVKTKSDVSDKSDISEKAEKIDDFGEKISGSRKEVWAKKLADFDPEEIKSKKDLTINKIFPLPDYEKLKTEGVSQKALSFIHVIRDSIKKELGRNRLSSLEQVKTIITPFIELAQQMSDIGYEKALDLLNDESYDKLRNEVERINDLGFPDVPADIAKYDILTDDPDRIIVVKGNYIISPDFTSKKDAQEWLKKRFAQKKEAAKKVSVKLEIFRNRRTGDISIAKKNGTNKFIYLKQGFKDSKEATIYLATHRAELEEQYKELIKIPEERRASNRDRIGEDHTKGKDVVPENFSKTFGFRGVQFGNWVENKKRQQDLNEAYNSLVDLANILNIPTKAISLNGELGLAFGARGHGRAMAHYEYDHTVINLTKKKGAGSLAHEWFHALDHYFGKQLGFETRLTDRTKPKYKLKGELDYGGMRPEVLEKAHAVMKTIENSGVFARSKQIDQFRTRDYWSTLIEMSARSFESYIIDRLDLQDSQNDYLANISSPEEYGRKDMYPYPLIEDKESINKAFDELFEAIKTKETDKGVALYSLKRDAAGFEKQVDDVSSGKLPKSGMIDVLARTPKAIQEAGAQDLPIEIRANKIKQILDKHSLPLDIIKHIPEQLDKPLMIFESEMRKDALVILTMLEHNGGSVMAALQLNKNRAHYEINRINSIYAKHKDVFVRYLKAGLLRYADKKEAPEWLHSVGLSEELLHQGSRDKSYQRLSKDKDNAKSSKSQADYSLNMVRAKQSNPGLSPEVQALNDAVQDGYDPGVRTHAELDKKADETIKKFGEDELLKNLASGHLVMNTDENMRLGLKLINSDKMIDMIRKGDIAAADAMEQWVKQGTEAGRLLNSRKLKTNSPEDIMSVLKGLLFAPSRKYRNEKDPAKKRELLKTHERKLINKALNNLKSKDIDFFNLTQQQLADIKLISTIAREIQIAKSDFGDKAYEWWINGLLSLPKTHAANIVGNTAMAVTELAPQRFVEASFNLLAKNKKGASFGEFKHMWKALRKHAKSGLRDAGIAFKTGTPIRDTVQKLETTNAAIGGKLGGAVRLPGRFLLAADEFAKSILIPVEATAYAYRIAKSEGLRGEALNERIKELTENGKSEAVEWATLRAEELTFQAKPWAFIEYLVAAKNEAGISGRILGYIFPFIRTPSNILTTTFRKSPFGSAALIARLATGKIKISDEKFIRHTAEQLIAWGTLMSLWSMMDDDDDELPFITGSKGMYGSGEYRWKQRNLPSTSIRLGDRWYDYSRIEPFGSALAMMVDGLNSISLINKGAEGEKAINNLMKSVMATNIRDKSFLQSMGDVIKAFEDPKSMSKLGTNFISSWVPNIARGTLNAIEDNVPDGYNYAKGIQFYKEQFLDGVGKRAGIGAVPRIDLWGNEIHKDDLKGDINPFLWRVLSPMRTRESGMHKPDELLYNWNTKNVNEQYWPMVPSPRYSKLHKSLYMNSDLYHKFAKRAGELAFGKIEQLISVGRLNHKRPSASDIKLLKKVFRKARQQAKRELLK